MTEVDVAFLDSMESVPLGQGEKWCMLCVGTRFVFPMRKDGQPDLRFARPVQPCPDCGATGVER